MRCLTALATWLLALCLGTPAQAQPLPQPATGRIERLASQPSQFVDARHVDVWLPDGYAQAVAAGQRFAVLYMHDGQMLFDASTTWNKLAWRADVALSGLMQAGRIQPTIIVGIWNNGPWRHSEYFPQKWLPGLPAAVRERFTREDLRGKPQADAYLKFVVQELKPLIDARYATLPDRAHTFVAGSSMGGLISVYAMSEYPQVFGGAAGLSTHWIGHYPPSADIPLAAWAYLRDHLPEPATHRLYQDHGTTELDAVYAPFQLIVNQVARDRGYTDQGLQANFMTRVFEGTGHNETDWAIRLVQPLEFLLSRERPLR